MNKKNIATIMALSLLFANFSVVRAEKKEIQQLNKWQDIVLLDSVERTSDKARNSTIEYYTAGANKYAFVAFGNGNGSSSEALVVYDVTDPANITEVTRYTDIVARIFNAQFVIVDDYLIATSRQSNGNNKLIMYSINPDGTLSSKATEICDGGNGIDTVYVCGDYLFYALAGTTGRHIKVFDVSNLSNGAVLKGNTANDYGVYAAEIEKISDSKYLIYYISRNQTAGWRFCINEMTVNNGTVSFNEKFHGTTGFESVTNLSSITDLQLINDKTIVITVSTKGENGTYSQALIDASGATPSVSEIASGRALSVIDVNDDVFAIGTQDGNIFFRNKSDNSQLHNIATGLGQLYDLCIADGKLFSSGESKVAIYDLYSIVSIDMDGISEINDGILNITADIEAKNTDVIKLDVFGETIDVTDDVKNGVLSYSENIDCVDGNYTAKISIVRDDEVILSDQKTFTVRKTMPVEITHSGLAVGTTSVTGTVENTHNKATAMGTAYLVVYNSDGSMSKAYPCEITALQKNETDSISFTLDTAVAAGQIVKLFVVDNEGRVISDIIETAQQSFNTVTDKIPAIVADKVNIYAEVDPNSIVAQISGKSAAETENIIFIAVYKPAPNNTQFDYINAFNTLADGSFYCSYPLQGGAEGENYTVNAYATTRDVLSGEKQFSYISQQTIDDALAAVQGADAATFESVAISERSPYKKVFNLNTSIYDTLVDPAENKYKLAVGAAVAGTLYSDISAFNTAFDKAVNEQKAIMDADIALAAALADVNSSAPSALPGKVEGYSSIFELDITGLYTKLDSTMKPNLYTNWIYDKDFTQKSQLQKAFKEGLAIEYLRFAQFGSIVENDIIENYYSELGLNNADVLTYSALDEQDRKDAIAYFLDLDLTNYSTLGSKFNEALEDYDDKPSGGSGGSTITSGNGGGGITIKPPVQAPDEIEKEELIPEDMLEIEKKNVFTDVKVDDWFFEAVCILNDRKIVEGISLNEFKPNQNVKREEFAKMIISAFNLVDYDAKTTFGDVAEGRWYYSYVATAQKLNLINGIGGGKFGIGQDMTRQDLAKLVYDTMKALGKPIVASGEATFADMDSVSAYAKEAVNALNSAGIMNGFNDNTFKPHGTVTRAMAAQVIYRIISTN